MKESDHPLFLAEYLQSELEKQVEAYQQSITNEEAVDKRKGFASRIIELEKKLIKLQGSYFLLTDYSGN